MHKQLLDHGYLECIRAEGDDRFIAQTARTSTESSGDEQADARLVTRLIRDEHTSPVEFVGFVVQAKMPIFVARQWVRHRAGTFNEFSGRYSEFSDDYYLPELERIQVQSTFNKQGSAESLPTPVAQLIQNVIKEQSDSAYKSYRALLETGLTRELARIILPVNFYTVWRWRVNLHNLFHFLRLREDPHAQYEIQVYANAMHELCKEHFPVSTAAFENHIQNQVRISKDLARNLACLIAEEYPLDFIIDALGGSEAADFVRRYSNE
jgi:thymidylate synthase (FAD)